MTRLCIIRKTCECVVVVVDSGVSRASFQTQNQNKNNYPENISYNFLKKELLYFKMDAEQA